MAAQPRIVPSDVFINIPFDRQHERIFLALIGGLVSLGLNPRCVLEVPASTDRLRRLHSIIRRCPFSLHDLSRVQTSQSGPFRVPRFNMPFELGIAVGISLLETSTPHEWRVLERIRHRLTQSLSDVAGYDPSVHNATVHGTLEVLLDIFDRAPHPPLSDTADLFWVYGRLRKFRDTLSPDIYRPSPYRKLVLAARGFATERVAHIKAALSS